MTRRREALRRGLEPKLVDRLFSEPRLAALYDTVCRGRPDFAFYLPLVMSADAVLDVGCGTGELLRRARQSGHDGRLCGLDPADTMLEHARSRTDVEWVLGDLSTVSWDHEFDLVVMTGHAFQVLLDDDQIRSSLAAIRGALTRDGRFAFETRNPSAHEWQQWTPAAAVEVMGADGVTVRVETEVEQAIPDGLVRFRQTYTSRELGRTGDQRQHAALPRPGRARRLPVRGRPQGRGAARGLGPVTALEHEPGDHHARGARTERPTTSYFKVRDATRARTRRSPRAGAPGGSRAVRARVRRPSWRR